MNIELIGKKLGMSQVYDEDNNLVPVTIIEAGPCPILQVKSHDKDGYEAIQIGFNPKGKAPNKPNKCQVGKANKVNVEPQHLSQEIRLKGDHSFEPGSSLTVENFSDVKVVDVISTTRGKGFQGVVKRWNFGGGPASHGSMFHRRGGSYGLCQWPGRVFKNKKMPGHTGTARRTTQNLQLVKILPEKNLLLIKGSVPGSKGTILTVRVAKKSKVSN